MSFFAGKSIIVTGGGSGIGRSTALQLGQVGAYVTVADKDVARAQETANQIETAGGRAQATETDVAVEADVEAMVERAITVYGHLYGAANIAGAPGCGLQLMDISIEQWQRVIGINLTGMFLCVKHQLRAMLRSGAGAIVNVSSATAIRGFPNAGEYSSSKAGILALTRTAANETGRAGIRVNSVLPGLVDTPMSHGAIVENPALGAMLANQHLIGRYGKPIEIAHAIRWLLSDEASFVTGATISIDGGQTAN